MPFISNTELATLENTFARTESKEEKRKAMEKRAREKGIAAVEAVGAAAGIGAIRGKLEASGTRFVIPGTELDGQMVIGAGLLVGSTLKLFGNKYSDDFFNAGLGIMSSFAFSVGRQFGKTGKASMVAGELENALGSSGL